MELIRGFERAAAMRPSSERYQLLASCSGSTGCASRKVYRRRTACTRTSLRRAASFCIHSRKTCKFIATASNTPFQYNKNSINPVIHDTQSASRITRVFLCKDRFPNFDDAVGSSTSQESFPLIRPRRPTPRSSLQESSSVHALFVSFQSLDAHSSFRK